MDSMPDITRILQDAAEWLMAKPDASHLQLAAAGELLIEAARVMRGQDALAEAMAAAPNVRAGLWRPRPAGPPDALDRLASVSRESAPCCVDHMVIDCPDCAIVSRETSTRGSLAQVTQSCGARYHCRGGQHCRCADCHDAGSLSLFPDLSASSASA
jgi:hypothetical protein